MTRALGNRLVVSSMEHTLLTAQHKMPTVNQTVLKLFLARGGRFTVQTGYSPAAVQAVLNWLPLKEPIICCHGALLWDFSADICIRTCAMNRTRTGEILDAVVKQFPQTGISVTTGNGVLRVVRMNGFLEKTIRLEKQGCLLEQMAELPEPWIKVTIAGDSANISRIEQLCGPVAAAAKLRPVRIAPEQYELVASEATGPAALEALAAYSGISAENMIVLGSCSTDLPSMKSVGLSVATAGAANRVKLGAGRVLMTRSEEGAVAEYLYSLIRNYEA